MTEPEKQEILRNFRIVIDYLKQQRDSEQTSVLQNTILYQLSSPPTDGLSIPTIPFPLVVSSTLTEQETQLDYLIQTANFISYTPADDLTDESIRSFAQALS